MKGYIISGIQQMGIGVMNVEEAWKWYIDQFGMDCCVFDDNAAAKLMLPYTGGLPRNKHAILAMNLQSGGGFEIWQYTEREPVKIKEEIISEFKEVKSVIILHSAGLVRAGEISLFVMTSAQHRREAIEACRKAVEIIKARLPVWKKEIFHDLTHRWTGNADSDESLS